MMIIMKIKTTFLRQPLFALGIVSLIILPGIALAKEANSPSENQGVVMAQGPGQEAGTKDKGARSDDNSLSSERRMRLQTINDVVRTHQTIQRVSFPRR
jgi:hypothetical protein